MDDEDIKYEDGIELLDPNTTSNSKMDVIKINVGRQIDRINRAISEPGKSCQEDAIAYKKLSSSIKALDAMIRNKASKKYKFDRLPLIDKMDKYEFELLMGKEVRAWAFYLKPAMELYSLVFVELSNLGLVPYDEVMDWEVKSFDEPEAEEVVGGVVDGESEGSESSE